MSYQERQSLVSLISTILVFVLYSAFMAQRYPDAGEYSPEVFRFWGAFILILIPVSIVTQIILHIVFSIINAIATREEESLIVDERDKLIELKATRSGLYVFAVGVLLAMGSLVINMPPSAMFIILIIAGMLSSVISDALQLVSYRRGL